MTARACASRVPYAAPRREPSTGVQSTANWAIPDSRSLVSAPAQSAPVRHRVCRSAQAAPTGPALLRPVRVRREARVSQRNRGVRQLFSTVVQRAVRNLPWGRPKGGTLAQRIIEMLIGRLITDEQFRCEFLDDPETTLIDLRDRGLELSRTEIAALVSTDPALWVSTAERLDPRLQKISLKNE
jgi:hypothetical protein